MDYFLLTFLTSVQYCVYIGLGMIVFTICGPFVFKKIGEWVCIGMSIGGMEVLQKINNSKEVKGEKHEKED